MWAAFSAGTTLVRSIATKLLAFIDTAFPSQTKFVIAEQSPFAYVFQAAEIYLRPKIVQTDNQVIADEFETVPLRWQLISTGENNRRFELTFPTKFSTLIADSYIPYLMVRAEEEKIVEIPTTHYWNLIDPPILDTLAMHPVLQQNIIVDLDLFVAERDMYRKLGEPWRRSYLVSTCFARATLIAAMADRLKFDVYCFHISDIYRNSNLRRIMSSTSDVPLLLYVDIDRDAKLDATSQFTLSGMLNLIRELWSSCGDNRVLIFSKDPRSSILHLDWIDIHIYRTRMIKIFSQQPRQ